MANITTENGTQDTLPPGLAVFLAVLNIFLSITSSRGNALILIALPKVSSIHSPTKLLFRCLAVTDLCVGLISQPHFVITLLAEITDINTGLLYYSDQVKGISGYILCPASVLISTAISVDRLLALLLRLRYRHVVTLRRVGAVVICVWLLSCAMGGWKYSTWRPDIVRIVLIVSMLLSLLVSLFSYGKIYFRLRHHQIQSQTYQGQPPNGGENPLTIARYKKSVSGIALVQLAILACYLPFIVIGTLFTYRKLTGGLSAMSYFLVSITILCLNSSLNPILYCWKIQEVRQAVKDTIRQLNCCKSNSVD